MNTCKLLLKLNKIQHFYKFISFTFRHPRLGWVETSVLTRCLFHHLHWCCFSVDETERKCGNDPERDLCDEDFKPFRRP